MEKKIYTENDLYEGMVIRCGTDNKSDNLYRWLKKDEAMQLISTGGIYSIYPAKAVLEYLNEGKWSIAKQKEDILFIFN